MQGAKHDGREPSTPGFYPNPPSAVVLHPPVFAVKKSCGTRLGGLLISYRLSGPFAMSADRTSAWLYISKVASGSKPVSVRV